MSEIDSHHVPNQTALRLVVPVQPCLGLRISRDRDEPTLLQNLGDAILFTRSDVNLAPVPFRFRLGVTVLHHRIPCGIFHRPLIDSDSEFDHPPAVLERDHLGVATQIARKNHRLFHNSATIDLYIVRFCEALRLKVTVFIDPIAWHPDKSRRSDLSESFHIVPYISGIAPHDKKQHARTGILCRCRCHADEAHAPEKNP